MSEENILYGGDFEKWSELNYPSLGALIIDKLKSGNVEKKFFINGSTGETWSRKNLLDFSLKIAKALHSIGVRQNDIISVVSDNRHEFIPIAFAVIYLNAVLAPVNYSYTERELKHAFELSKPKFVFTSSLSIKNVSSVCKNLSFVEKIILIDGPAIKGTKVISLKSFIEDHSKNDFDVLENVSKAVNFSEQSSVIFLSSGTTGAPKGVELSQQNFASVFRESLEGMKELCRNFSPNLKFLGIAPWSHVMGFFGTINSLLISDFDLTIFLPRFEAKLFFSLIEKFKVNILIAAPPVLVLMSKTPLLDEFDLSSLKMIFSGAAHLTKEVEDQVKERLKRLAVLQGYGLSETSYGIIGMYNQMKPGSIGKIMRGNFAKVIDEDGKVLGANKVGEVCCKGNKIMKGYLNDPKATAETIDKDGWLRTGDLGYFDDDQQFFIVDRLKELIKFKGFQVPPAELEGLLLSHPKIKDAGVIGIPDESAGELPFAFVVKQPNLELTEDEVKNFVKQNASNAKWLRGGVKFIEEIPKNPSGKILRRELRDLYKSMRAKL